MIREALENNVVVRPITPAWGLVEGVLSDALLKVLQDGEEKKPMPDKWLDEFVERLKKIPRDYGPCAVVSKKAPDEERCQVVVQPEKSFAELASDLARDHGVEIDPATLAKVNGRDESEPVRLQKMKILLVP